MFFKLIHDNLLRHLTLIETMYKLLSLGGVNMNKPMEFFHLCVTNKNGKWRLVVVAAAMSLFWIFSVDFLTDKETC